MLCLIILGRRIWCVGRLHYSIEEGKSLFGLDADIFPQMDIFNCSPSIHVLVVASARCRHMCREWIVSYISFLGRRDVDILYKRMPGTAVPVLHPKPLQRSLNQHTQDDVIMNKGDCKRSLQ